MASSAKRFILYTNHICPFCQRIEFLLRAKGLWEQVDVRILDLATPRPAWFLEKTGGTTSVPVLELPDGSIIKESLVLLRYVEDVAPGHSPADAYGRAVLNQWLALEGDFVSAGYRFVMNTDETKRAAVEEAYVAQVKRLDAFLRRHAPHSVFLFAQPGLAEAAYAPFFLRFSPLLAHYDLWHYPAAGVERFMAFHDACLALLRDPALSEVSEARVVKAYYDYAVGSGNGKLPAGRTRSSFSVEPDYDARPLPPKDKWHVAALTDQQLGLVA